MTAAATPYSMDSSVSGFPLGKYVKIVMPSWLNAGFTSAASAAMGSSPMTANRTAFCPFSVMAYASAPAREMARYTGCIKHMEKSRTSA